MSAFVFRLLLALSHFSLAGANTLDARQKMYSMEIRPTGSQEIHRHVHRDDALMRRHADGADALLQEGRSEGSAEDAKEERKLKEEEKKERQEIAAEESQMQEEEKKEMQDSVSEEKEMTKEEENEMKGDMPGDDEMKEFKQPKMPVDDDEMKEFKEPKMPVDDDEKEMKGDMPADDDEMKDFKESGSEPARPMRHRSDALLQEGEEEEAKDKKRFAGDADDHDGEDGQKDDQEESNDEGNSDGADNDHEDHDDGEDPNVQIESKTVSSDDDAGMAQDQKDLQEGADDDSSDSPPSPKKGADKSSSGANAVGGGSAATTTGSGKIIAARKERRQCQYWQNMGCLLDVMEKSCEPDEGSPKNLIEKTSVESAWMCCCPNPYQPCTKSQRDKKCDAAMNKHVAQHMHKDVKPQTLMTALQKVRGEMRNAGGAKCKVLAPEGPTSTCGYAHKPKVSRSIGRADLFCEMLSWQMEELGDGNEPEFTSNGCPYNENHRASGDNSGNRKGNALSDDEILNANE